MSSRWNGMAVAGLVVFGGALALVPIGGAGSQATPIVRVVSPKSGAMLSGTRVVFKIRTTNFTITDQGTTVNAREGHLHVTLDKRPFVAIYTPRFVFRNVQSGAHVMRVEVVNSAHKPIRKPIIVRFRTQ